MSHANAALTPRARLRLARLVIDQGLPITRAAERHDVSGPTAKRWADRYQVSGAVGMGDQSRGYASLDPRVQPPPAPHTAIGKATPSAG